MQVKMTPTAGISDQELAEIEARANAALPGPWQIRCLDYKGKMDHFTYDKDGKQIFKPAFEVDYTDENGERDSIETLGDYECGALEKPNAEFIAHARTDVPRLIAEVRETRAALKQARQEIEAAYAVLLTDPAKADRYAQLRGKIAAGEADAK
jgi:hypothetical protein